MSFIFFLTYWLSRVNFLVVGEGMGREECIYKEVFFFFPHYMVLVAQWYLTLCNPVDCSLNLWNSWGKDTEVGKPFPSPGDFPNPGIKPGSPALWADSLPFEPPGKFLFFTVFFFFFYPKRCKENRKIHNRGLKGCTGRERIKQGPKLESRLKLCPTACFFLHFFCHLLKIQENGQVFGCEKHSN